MREALEGVLAPALVSRVIFDALESHGESIPSTPRDLIELVRGPLRARLVERLGLDTAAIAVEHVIALLQAMDEPRSIRGGTPIRVTAPESGPTLAIPTGPEPVPVVVIAGATAMLCRLEAALGSRRLAAWPAVTADDVRASLKQGSPAIVLVDAGDIPAIAIETLASFLASVPSTAVCAVWASELPFARRLAVAAKVAGADLVWLSRKDGVEPLLDLIRSRQSA